MLTGASRRLFGGGPQLIGEALRRAAKTKLVTCSTLTCSLLDEAQGFFQVAAGFGQDAALGIDAGGLLPIFGRSLPMR